MSDMNVHPRGYAPDTYAVTGKIMLSAIVILFTVVLLIICLHLYARWFIARRQRQHQQFLRNRRRRRAHIAFTTDLSYSAGATISHGLEPSLLKSLPTFVYSSTTHDEVLECAVCLSEFEENEKGRLLPKCNHSFHIGCIDMWFHSHSTCPLCRSPIAKPEYPQQAQTEIVINSNNPQPNSSHSRRREEDETSSSSSSNENTSVGCRRKGFDITGVSIEVPRRTEEMAQGSPAGVFKSPAGRLLSFKMRLGRRNSSTSISCSSATEIDLERGEIEEDHVHVPPSSDHSVTH